MFCEGLAVLTLTCVFTVFCRFPVCAMGVLRWVDHTVSEPSYFKLNTDHTPLHLVLVDEVSTNHSHQTLQQCQNRATSDWTWITPLCILSWWMRWVLTTAIKHCSSVRTELPQTEHGSHPLHLVLVDEVRTNQSHQTLQQCQNLATSDWTWISPCASCPGGWGEY